MLSCASDAAGNAGTASFSVLVRDTIAPLIGATTNVTTATTNPAGTAASYTMPTVRDAVRVTSFVCSPSSGSVFPIGTTTVACTVRDAALNTTTMTFTFTVQLLFVFGGLQVPATANQGSVVPLVWLYSSGGTVIDNGALVPVVRVRTLTSCTNGTETGAPFIDKQAPDNTISITT